MLLVRLRGSHGVRAGMLLAVATLAMNGAGYLYNVGAIRYLGSAGYGDVAALLALVSIVALPLGSVQNLLAREVAQLPGPEAAGPLLRRTSALALAIATGLVAMGLALSGPLGDLLNVDSRAVVAAGVTGVFFAVVSPVLNGFLQGGLRFGALGVVYSLSGLARPLLVAPVLLAGFGAAGALAVNTVAGGFAVLLAAWALRRLWSVGRGAPRQTFNRREMTVLLIGSLAFASLTNVDVLLASYFLGDEDAGVYAAAALVGKAVLFLPGAVVMVLLPKAASRAAAGFTAQRILLASAGVTLILTVGATVVLALTPESALVSAFGGDFRDSTELLGWFGLAMTAAALVNVYLSVYFAERDARFPLLVLGAALAQIVAVSVWHPSALSIVIVTLLCSSTILVVHELAFPHSLFRVWRGLRASPATG